jgi:hypothetical protein
MLQVLHFGRCWARWVGSHGGARAIEDATYLTAAEPFVQAFLEGTAAAAAGPGEGPGGRPEGAFQGVVLAVDVEEHTLNQVGRFCGANHACGAVVEHYLLMSGWEGRRVAGLKEQQQGLVKAPVAGLRGRSKA